MVRVVRIAFLQMLLTDPQSPLSLEENSNGLIQILVNDFDNLKKKLPNYLIKSLSK